ncbi:MAG: M2 family metallopeptidase [Caldisericia bacterium]
MELKEFLDKTNKEIKELIKEVSLNYWNLATTGEKEWEEKYKESDLKLRKYLSDKDKLKLVENFLKDTSLSKIEHRQLILLRNDMIPNQIEEEKLKELSTREIEIESVFINFRGKIDGKEVSDNEIIEILRKEKDSNLRKKAWEASKEIGEIVGPKIYELIKLRNKIARGFGYNNYYEMMFDLQELNVNEVHKNFKDFKSKSDTQFMIIKDEIDERISEKLGISKETIMPWHYSDRFFQEAPLVYEIPFEEIFKDKNVEELTKKTYSEIGMETEDIIKRSDLYERKGKNQHAFCIYIDREDDVRILANIRPNEKWMETMLHEMGHAVYDKYIDKTLPVILRTPSHIFTTEAVAMFFGRMIRKPIWYQKILKSDSKFINKYSNELNISLRDQLMIEGRWIITFVFFEKMLYETEENINNLWYDFVSQNQFLNIPEERKNKYDWAAKIHFGTNPVYYQNYLLGEMMASQLYFYIKDNISEDLFNKKIGAFFINKIFKPGASLRWDELLTTSTGETLNPEYIIKDLSFI